MSQKQHNIEIALHRELYFQYTPLLIDYAQRFVPYEDAEDIVHDIFLHFWDKGLLSLPPDELRRLLYTSAKNACLNYLKQKQRRQSEHIDREDISLQIAEISETTPEDLTIQQEIRQQLNNIIAKLPQRSQDIFRMAYIEGLRTVEIANKLDISVRTVENLRYRSISFIRKRCTHLLLIILLFSLFL